MVGILEPAVAEKVAMVTKVNNEGTVDGLDSDPGLAAVFGGLEASNLEIQKMLISSS